MGTKSHGDFRQVALISATMAVLEDCLHVGGTCHLKMSNTTYGKRCNPLEEQHAPKMVNIAK